MLWLLRLAGIGQIGLFCASFMIPKILHWNEELAKLRPLTCQAWAGRLWGAFWLLTLIMFLFHVPFLRGVIWPIIGMN